MQKKKTKISTNIKTSARYDAFNPVQTEPPKIKQDKEDTGEKT